MDGGSTDETISVMRALQCDELIWRSEFDSGVVHAVNKGFQLARGEILTVQSSDDVFTPEAVEAAVTAFSEDSSLGLVYGDVELIDEQSHFSGADIQGRFDLAEYFGRLMYVPQPGAFFIREALAAVGGWRAEFSYAADADFWLRIATRFPVKKLDRIVGRYRYHPAQRDRNKSHIERDWEAMVISLLQNETIDSRTRRYALSGIFLARHRYADESQWFKRSMALYGAMLVNPVLICDRRVSKRELIPGRQPIWKLLSSVKRRLGFRPRGSAL
jgi:glycosyltransferase involved in cell wall biosynthesis